MVYLNKYMLKKTDAESCAEEGSLGTGAAGKLQEMVAHFLAEPEEEGGGAPKTRFSIRLT